MSRFHRDLLRSSEPPAFGSGVVSASDPFELWQLEPLSVEDFARLADGHDTEHLSLAQLQHLAAYNLLAPSSHNTVPQRFLFPSTGNAIDICVDRDVILAASDPMGRQALISIGCGIANLRHAARAFGFESKLELEELGMMAPVSACRAGEARYLRVARVHFRRCAPDGPRGPLRAMLERKTVRADYNASVVLPGELGSALTEIMRTRYSPLEFHLIRDARTLGFLGDLQELADSTMLSREDFTSELGQWLLENDSDSPLGMRGREYGLTDAMTHGVQNRLSEAQLDPEEVAALARGGNVGIRSSSAVAIIVAPRDDSQHRVLAGQAFEDLVLVLHQYGFVSAMHAGVTEVESANLALSARLGTQGRPVVVFRMGQPLEPKDSQRPHSGRPSVADVTLLESQLSLLSARAAS